MNARPTKQGKPRRPTGKLRRRKHPREGHGPPLQTGGKCCGQPGNHDPRVIANPCRGRFYIGPVCGAANAPGGYLRPKSRTCGLWPPKRACGRSGIRPYSEFSTASGLPVGPVVAGRRVGEGHAPPANLTPPQSPREGHGPPLQNGANFAANRPPQFLIPHFQPLASPLTPDTPVSPLRPRGLPAGTRGRRRAGRRCPK